MKQIKPIPIKYTFIVFIFACGIIVGIMFGMAIQQMIFIAGAIEIAQGLEGTTFNIEVDVNETIMVDRMIDFFNETIIEGLEEGK